jgi:hypothetical protein
VLHEGIPILDGYNRVFLPDHVLKENTITLGYPSIFQLGHPYILEVQFSYLDEIDQAQYQHFKIEIYQDASRREQRVDIIRGDTSFKNTQPN